MRTKNPFPYHFLCTCGVVYLWGCVLVGLCTCGVVYLCTCGVVVVYLWGCVLVVLYSVRITEQFVTLRFYGCYRIASSS